MTWLFILFLILLLGLIHQIITIVISKIVDIIFTNNINKSRYYIEGGTLVRSIDNPYSKYRLRRRYYIKSKKDFNTIHSAINKDKVKNKDKSKDKNQNKDKSKDKDKNTRLTKKIGVEEYKSEIQSKAVVSIMGEFKTGKSSLINSLLNEDLLKAAITPATAKITKICYGSERKVLVHFKNGSIQEFSELAFHELTAQQSNMALGEKNIQDSIDFIEIFIDQNILKNIILVDTPGLNVDNPEHIKTTMDFINNSDFIIWVLSASKGVSRTELNAIKALKIKPLVVINRIDEIDDEEEDIESVIGEIKKILHDLVTDTIGVSALCAIEGRKNNNKELLEFSNLYTLLKLIENKVINKDIFCKNWI
ncbi:MAG: hypothetical protein ATN31_03030 [Candidatus Epulonipiscioides saccharophilum]|nr:MAG: hypothetical protein ATN31_03030 [Epulopiscium sp. AS2M-Bin001]